MEPLKISNFLDQAIESVVEALAVELDWLPRTQIDAAARIAVEAAAPHLRSQPHACDQAFVDLKQRADRAENTVSRQQVALKMWIARAEQAKAEVERLGAGVERQKEFVRNAWDQADAYIKHIDDGWALADQLAETLRELEKRSGPA